jgi:hypothetical protein
LRIPREIEYSDVALNAFGLVVAFDHLLYIYAFDNEWLKKAMDHAIGDPRIIDARRTYRRTQVRKASIRK